jgi:sugar phosphate isomerase/epimerase
MKSKHPVFICVAQYQSELIAGQMSMIDVIAKARQFGVAGVEFRKEPWKAYQDELPLVRKELEAAGLLANYATFNPLFTADEEGQQRLCHDVDIAAGLGARLLRVFSGAVPTSSVDPAWARAGALIASAADRGLTVVLENYGKTPGHTLAEVCRTLDGIVSPALKTNIDVGNYFIHGQDIVAAIRALSPFVIYAHIKDQANDHSQPPTYLGGGDLPLGPVLDELDSLPQDVSYCFEFVGGGDPDGRIARSLAYLQARD